MPRIYCFTHETLLEALEDWRREALEAYPHQAERIETTVAAMRDFFDSEHIVRRHKLNVPEAEDEPPH